MHDAIAKIHLQLFQYMTSKESTERQYNSSKGQRERGDDGTYDVMQGSNGLASENILTFLQERVKGTGIRLQSPVTSHSLLIFVTVTLLQEIREK